MDLLGYTPVMPPQATPRRTVRAEFYRSEAGNEPVRDFLLTLTKEERRAIGADVRTTEYGWPLGMPTCRSVGHGLWEVRSNLPTRIARVFFCLVGHRMVLLHGIVKKA